MIRSLIKRALRPRPPKIYPSYSAAQAICGSGYEADTLTEVVAKKTKRFRDAESPVTLDAGSLRIVMALSGLGRKVKVLDFGGACGFHRFVADKVFGGSIAFDWMVVETPAMAKRGQEYFGAEDLRFTDSLAKAAAHFSPADGPDLIFVSGSIHFPEQPRKVLEELLLIPCERFFLTRTPAKRMPGGVDGITVQRSLLSENGHGRLPEGYEDRAVFYPSWILDRDSLIAQISAVRPAQIIMDEGEGYVGCIA